MSFLVEWPFFVWLLIGGFLGYFLRPKVLIVTTVLIVLGAGYVFVTGPKETLAALIPILIIFNAFLITVAMWLTSAFVRRKKLWRRLNKVGRNICN